MGLVFSFPEILSLSLRSGQKNLLGSLYHNHLSILAYMVIGTDKHVLPIMGPHSDVMQDPVATIDGQVDERIND